MTLRFNSCISLVNIRSCKKVKNEACQVHYHTIMPKNCINSGVKTFFMRTPFKLISSWFSRFCRSSTLKPQTCSPMSCLMYQSLDVGQSPCLLIYDFTSYIHVFLYMRLYLCMYKIGLQFRLPTDAAFFLLQNFVNTREF